MNDFELSKLLFSVVLLLSMALGLGHLFTLIRLPRVVGEIAAGTLLGPSLLGFYLPEVHNWIFSSFPEQKKLLSVFYWFGLILLMFSVGLNLPNKTDRTDKLIISCLFFGAITLPVLFGFLLAESIPNKMGSNDTSFALIIAVASGVTSIPVLSRIFMDLNILSTRFAKVILTTAAYQDLVLWIVVSIAVSLHTGTSKTSSLINSELEVILGTTGFIFFVAVLVPYILRVTERIFRKTIRDSSLIGYAIAACLVLVILASIFKVSIVFSALLAGVVIGRFSADRMLLVKQNITNFSIWFFVPIYFALVGLQINMPLSLNTFLFFKIFILTSIIKIVSVMIFVRLARTPWLKCFDYGVAMNARGGPGIVLASIAYAAQIIDDEVFLVIVLVSVITSLFAGFWLWYRRTSIANL